ncbi:efflux RND transporter periplasmic adaptor subunit [Rubinisphaera margarita]|uniref:efflux RND transporter periplasmic adaptor subunit n=1 Tax=Rubinisphaera margarita TaxID=2909586 RepID=UPI001EE91060|nr:hypothetical protein [Rubinisphaera margarita]MCG6156337.1 hypothetical protein [Rubinisphaera margarita]
MRREYLTFDRAGRVTYVRPGDDGKDLREGATVKKGESLARLDDRQSQSEIDSAKAAVAEANAQLKAARAEIQQSVTQYQLAQSQFARTQRLFDQKATSRAEYDEAEANVKNSEAARDAAQTRLLSLESSVAAAEARLRQATLALEEIEITSPIDGIIAYLNVEEGYYFMQSNVKTTSEAEALQTVPIVVIDPTEFEITVNIPAFDSGLLETGLRVLIMTGGSSEADMIQTVSGTPPSDGTRTELLWTAQGEIFSVNPAVNPGGRSVQVQIRTVLGADQLRDGMFVTSWIEIQNKPDAIVAPFNAFLYEENRPYVFVIDERNIARRRAVVPGIQGLAGLEIVSGVEEGERLAIDGRHRLVDGSPVRVIETRERVQHAVSIGRITR